MRESVLAIIRDLERCAKENEADAKSSSWIPHSLDSAQARAVAAEQRRMMRVLRKVIG